MGIVADDPEIRSRVPVNDWGAGFRARLLGAGGSVDVSIAVSVEPRLFAPAG